MDKFDLEDTRLTAECLVYALQSVNRYPPKHLREAAEGIGDLKKLDGEIRLGIIDLYFSLDPNTWDSIVSKDSPKAAKLAKWVNDNFKINPGIKEDS